MKSLFEFNKELCTACGACLLACIDQNDNDIDKGELFRHVFTVEEKEKVEYFSLSCVHCDEAKCVDVCPKDCFKKEHKFVILDNQDCIGCKLCEKACEYGALIYGNDGKANKCNGCVERNECGMDAPCVMVCPTGALKFNMEV
ncbi:MULTISPECIES: 4Fe-4S dicluster domain-containing protein [unclassified Clostridioides]|uniref:4Fe-4S dicluster domain-containing protein n=1 Tax=unclassified Clostridioides TaxID=2635829 RepID=UPI001D106543|nr:4Fe-4S binding protein [Clostridioides sp. ZZV15-6388]MCC0643496.1 4Fe-4S binding protein [Clostridioides sp. ZZV14-6150]MCC0658676.1 4Fe-4S binding protein [Clostridioides sp. ZZV14-6154]MCC0666184.1 4Fe-4S binding protein [Clostridioides sp. ZZV15-6597]MCC0668862.1 4Fe-4S binding protein [Clostridioides sp. ZZV14-6153]MCC0719748.1 4Fe-4S binding protein [Clostridioides sp. ZZV14-6105]MCC0721671.1 4Fe-4S binding protein [Clostridioides sp. ZZV14-6104]MCC0725145.1 4Fe-4S binding protein [